MRAARLAAILMALLCLYGAAFAETQLTLTFVGDCTLGGEERLMGKDYSFAQVAQREGYAYFLSEVAPLFNQDDATVANFEGVLKADAKGKANKTYCFRGLPAYAQILPLGSVEIVNLSNNHAADYGTAGLKSTKAALLEQGVGTFDATQAYWLRKDGVSIAFCGFWRTGYYKNRDAYRQTIRDLRAQGADAVVCILHFGQEYSPTHSADQEEMAHTMIDAGADLVVGHHPHVVQGVETYGNRTILYSLGNFVFGGNTSVRANDCLVARVTLTFDAAGAYGSQQLRLYPAHISGDATQNTYQPRLVQGDAAQAVFALVDADGAGQPTVAAQTDEYRDYVVLPAMRKGVQP